MLASVVVVQLRLNDIFLAIFVIGDIQGLDHLTRL